MSKIAHLSRYYCDDKDVSDLLSLPSFSPRALLRLGRERGLFLSRDDDRDAVVAKLSQNPFTWIEIQRIFGIISAEDREERRATCRLEEYSDIDKVQQAVEQVRDERAARCDEVYNITKRVDGTLVVAVKYTEIDTTRTRGIQRRERDLTVEFEPGDGRVAVRFNQNERANNIVERVIERIQAGADANIKRTAISLAGVLDPAKRTKFFIDLIQGTSDFRVIDVNDLKVDQRLPEKDLLEGEGEDDGVKPTERPGAAEVKALVRKVALSGQSLLTSEFYQQLRSTGYFITHITWRSKETGGLGLVAELIAEFTDPVNASGFTFDVKKILPREGTDDTRKTASELLSPHRTRLRRLIENAAYIAFGSATSSESPEAPSSPPAGV